MSHPRSQTSHDFIGSETLSANPTFFCGRSRRRTPESRDASSLPSSSKQHEVATVGERISSSMRLCNWAKLETSCRSRCAMPSHCVLDLLAATWKIRSVDLLPLLHVTPIHVTFLPRFPLRSARCDAFGNFGAAQKNQNTFGPDKHGFFDFRSHG